MFYYHRADWGILEFSDEDRLRYLHNQSTNDFTSRQPVEGMVWVSVGGDRLMAGTDFEVDYTTGLVTFPHPPDVGAEIRAGFEFDVPVRFDTDRIQTSVASFKAGDVPSVPIVEIRV